MYAISMNVLCDNKTNNTNQFIKFTLQNGEINSEEIHIRI